MQCRGRIAALIWWLAVLYPLGVVLLVHLTWLVAMASLGHMPEASVDDPKYISSLVSVCYYVTAAAAILTPAMPILGVAASVFAGRQATANRRLAYTYLFIVLGLAWVAAAMLWRWDPVGVAVWFLD